MAVSLMSVFLTTLLIGLLWFFLLSLFMMLLLKLSEFRKPSIKRLSWAYLARYIICSFLAGLTSMYFYVSEQGSTQENAWAAVFFSLLLWSIFIVVAELLAVKAED